MEITKNYDVDYFIEKFKAIPEELWCVGKFQIEERCCALGHCEERKRIITEESKSLRIITKNLTSFINDGVHGKYRQSTPKQRILAALEDIKKGTYEREELFSKY